MPISDTEIFNAIEQNQFTPYFQPLVDLRDGSIQGFEVLARWQHPTLGLIDPNKFIPRAEHHGLMNSLSMSLFRQAFAAARIVPSEMGISVNLSPAQLHDRSLPSFLQRIADETHFDLKRLTVEITESALLTDMDIAALTAVDLKTLGIRLCMDDFGTGYSSLLHLQAMPFDELKVDISFVRSMVKSRQSRKITAAVIGLARSLGLRTVAEGIEGSSQADLLLWQGCNLGQGWLYGYPQPADKLAEMLAQPLRAPAAAPSLVADLYVALDAHPTERLSQLQAIYDSAPVGLGFLDTQLRYVNLNQRLALMTGKPVQSFVGLKFADAVPELYVQLREHLKRALEGIACTSVDLELPVSESSSAETARLASCQPVRDETGAVIGVCISIQEVSASAQSTEILRRGTDYFRREAEQNQSADHVNRVEASLHALVDTALIGILFADAATDLVVKANARAEEILGRKMTSETLWMEAACDATDVHGRSIDLFDRALARAIRMGETTLAQELVLRRPDGSRIWVRLSAAPVRSGTGEIIGGVMTIHELESVNRERQKLLQMPIRPATPSTSADASSSSSAPTPRRHLRR